MSDASQPGVDALKGREVARFGGVWLAVGGVLLLGAVVRGQYLADVGYWFDEAFCWKVIQYPWLEQWGRAAEDNHPPFFFYAMSAWAVVGGDTVFSLRLFCALLGVTAIAGLYLLVWEAQAEPGESLRTSPVNPTALLAAVLLALNHFQIEYSQMVRMYVLGATLTAWSCWALLRALRRSGWRDWGLYSLLATALIYTHYYGLFVVAAQWMYAGLWLLGRLFFWETRAGAWRQSGQLLFACWCIVTLWLFWLENFLAQKQQVTEVFWTRAFEFQHILKICNELLQVKIQAVPAEAISSDWWGFGVLAGVSGVVLLLGRRGERLLALGVIMTFACAIFISLGPRSILTLRYFLFAHLLFLGCVAICISKLPTLPVKVVAACVVLGISLQQCLEQHNERLARAERPGMPLAMEYLNAEAEAAEPILVANPMVHTTALPYAENLGQVFVLSGHRQFPHHNGTAVLRAEEYLSPVQLMEKNPLRLWTVDVYNWTGGTRVVAVPEQWLAVNEYEFYDWLNYRSKIVVREYLRRDQLKSVARN